MLKTQRAAYVALLAALDIAALLLAFVVAWAVRDSLGDFLVWLGDVFNYPVRSLVHRSKTLPEFYRIVLSPHPLVNIQRHLWILYLSIPVWLCLLNVQRGYDVQARRNSRQDFAVCAYTGLLGTAALMVFMVLAKFDVSRLLIVGFMIWAILFSWLGRAVVLPFIQQRGRLPERNLVFIGSRTAAAYFTELLKTPAYRSSRLLGFVWDESPEEGVAAVAKSNVPETLPHLGNLSDLTDILDRDVVDEVVLVRSQADAVSRDSVQANSHKWSDVLELCLQRGRTVSLVDDIVPPVNAKVEATMMGSMPTLVLHNTPQSTLGLAAKSLMDRTVALLALFFLTFIFPVFPAIALVIKITAPGPVFFRQKRVGLNGRTFWFYKFRSMIVDAEKFKEAHPELFAEINTMSGPFFKSEDDPRITKVGRFLRKYSLDELPQFWNVLRGDMSLVGPRPPLPREVAQLEPWQRRKLSVKGGLTCSWQVSGRNDIDTDEWMRLDLEYIDNWSLWLDVKLLFKTLKVLVRPKGAS